MWARSSSKAASAAFAPAALGERRAAAVARTARRVALARPLSTSRAGEDEGESGVKRVEVPANIPQHKLEEALGNTFAAVQIRRHMVANELAKTSDDYGRVSALYKIPSSADEFDVPGFYEEVHGSNCENVIGYMPLPVGVVGPLLVNGEEYTVPLATTEGALLASTNRGARAIRESGGVLCCVTADGMTRSPVVALPSAMEAVAFKKWIDESFEDLHALFQETTNHGKLESVNATIAGRYVFMRFRATTGDAMGMNMVGKGVNHIIQHVLEQVPDAQLISLSSNMCTDKKPSAINWTQGRGKSVVAEVTLPRAVVEKVLKTTVADLAQLNIVKNLVGSALAGSIGGNNAHASNLVTAFFLATGQDPAQNVVSSNCMILMEPVQGGEALHVTATMPSIEVGTVGGGTSLTTQRACLEMLGVAGSSPGAQNAQKLATLVCATVLAGEISLNAALASNNLISAHMALNRKAPPSSPAPAAR